MYPAIVYGSTLGADGAGNYPISSPNSRLIRLLGTVIASGTANDPLLNKRVFLNPSRGWDKHPIAPESKYGPFHFWNPTLIMIDKVSAFWVVEQTPQSVLSQNTSSWNVIKSFQHPIT